MYACSGAQFWVYIFDFSSNNRSNACDIVRMRFPLVSVMRKADYLAEFLPMMLQSTAMPADDRFTNFIFLIGHAWLAGKKNGYVLPMLRYCRYMIKCSTNTLISFSSLVPTRKMHQISKLFPPA